MSAHEHYRRGLGTALRHNQVAYAYSAMTTALFGVLQQEKPGPPQIGQMFLYIVGAAAAFAVVNATVTKWFSERLPREVPWIDFAVLPRKLVEMVRLPSGALWDDVGVVACRPRRVLPGRVRYALG